MVGSVRRARQRKRLAGAVFLAVLAAGVAVVPAEAAPAARTVPVLRWTGCGAPYECATARVPLDHDDPGGPPISLALIRLPASHPGRRIGTLFVNPGGPGGSGVELVREGAAQKIWTPEVLARFDVVGFDPRGVGASAPIRCFASDEDEAAFFGTTPFFPYQQRQIDPFIATYAQYGGICLRHNGPIMRHLSTANVARDLDLLRRAVGDARLTFDGASYGSFIGSVYANLFPNRVRAMVLDGVIDPVAWTTGRPPSGHTLPFSVRTGDAHGAQAAVGQFLTRCDAAGPAACALAPNAGRKLDRLFTASRVELVGGLGYDTINTIVLGILYSTRTWATGAGFLRRLYDAAFAGAAPSAPVEIPSELAGLARGNASDALNAVQCADSVNPRDPYAWVRAAARQDALGLVFGPTWAWTSAACATWPAVDDDKYLGPFTRTTSAPVLVIGNRYDPATTYHGALVVDDLLPRSRLLTMDGAGHTTWSNSSRCIDVHVQRYLIAGMLPPVGARCAPDLQPFVDRPAAGRSVSAVEMRPPASRP